MLAHDGMALAKIWVDRNNPHRWPPFCPPRSDRPVLGARPSRGIRQSPVPADGGRRMKTNFRRSKTDRSTLRRVDLLIRRGWQPGRKVSDYYRGNRRHRTGAGRRATI